MENDVSADHIIAELLDMGFEFSEVMKAIGAVGSHRDDVLECLLNGSCDINTYQYGRVSSNSTCSTSQEHSLNDGLILSYSPKKLKQSSITHRTPSFRRTRRNISNISNSSLSHIQRLRPADLCGPTVSNNNPRQLSQSSQQGSESFRHFSELKLLSQENESSLCQDSSDFCSFENQEVVSDWEIKVSSLLQKHFAFSSLKGFQKEALDAWLAHKDCLVLAATGSGKSLCFQIPALFTRKVVVVISPLISLMHDQCLKLANHGISACFLGSGQPDSSVEQKAMNGLFKIVYVCPETLLRLMEALKKLAESPGIALFAIDEVHCVSKWGHDFRPDYRRLSVLRENFNTSKLKFLKFDIPLMALTATATIPVRQDIVKSLHMSKEMKIILTSFFRPNLQFTVKHSKTTSVSSYEKDFHELIETYTAARVSSGKSLKYNNNMEDNSDSSSESISDGISDEEEPKENLEDELDFHHEVDDMDVSCGEFLEPPAGSSEYSAASEISVSPGSLELGPTIVYVPTRKETLVLAEYLSKSGVRAAAYHAKLPKALLRRVHEEFHHNDLEVVVATVAFGMGIDKSNVRRIIHYGWPQSLEAYYQEAGRAGRDGKLSNCTLYANLLRIPTLLPSQRSEEQTKQAYKMLSDCFRYAMSTATCRAKTLVKYFGEEFGPEGCHLCDICVNGPPKIQNLKEEVDIIMGVLKAECGHTSQASIHGGTVYGGSARRNLRDRPNFRMVISRMREKFPKFAASDRLWWQGLARILESMGYIREGDELPRVSIRYPELTDAGLKFLTSESEEPLYAYPEADMLLSEKTDKPYSTFSEWGQGWADPEIRRQRLEGKRSRRKKKKRHSRKDCHASSTVRGRLAVKLSKRKKS
ncbi:ATP-dependent DNA helicase Q-like SIM [Typha angustifolia]|uniref:ATP-dependent DNA helicase Q-like SIM n=1 Tax=Typha angustifolia TaxID=59011 RepID=UPI003C2D3D03